MKNEQYDPKMQTGRPDHSIGAPCGPHQKHVNKRNRHNRNTKSRGRRIEKKPLNPHRIRQIKGSFAFVEHRFLRDGFWANLDGHQLLLYLFLIVVADRNGLSYYGYDKICSLLRITVDEYIVARNTLIDQDLIAFDGNLFQVLSLPDQPVLLPSSVPKDRKKIQTHGPVPIRQLIENSLGKIQ